MNKPNLRMTEPGEPPPPEQIESWIGIAAYSYWTRITSLIEQKYPGVFTPEWLFGGSKHGWSLRYKKNRSFCTLIPERELFALLLVFGAEERAKVETIRDKLSPQTLKYYDEARTYHDGKWLRLTVDSAAVVDDIEQLLGVKRKPK